MKVVAELHDDSIAIAFPYDEELVHKAKYFVSAGVWKKMFGPLNGMRRPGAWVYPYSIDRWREIVHAFGPLLDSQPEILDRVQHDEEKLHTGLAIKAAQDGVVDGYTYVDPQPYAHQRMGHAFLDLHEAAGLLWEMGTGKTRPIIDDILWRKITGRLRGPALVFCPNEVKWTQWARQIPLWSDGALTVEVLRGPSRKKKVRLLESPADVLVLNVESALFLEKALLDRDWDYVVLDEATRFKSHRAKRTKVILKMAERTKVRRILTGTPITNAPTDVYAPFSFIHPNLFGNWWSFERRYLVKGGYGGYQIIGYRNLDELKSKVHMYTSRVLKKDVLDLPPKTYIDLEVEMQDEVWTHYQKMRDELRTEWQSIGGDSQESQARIILTQMLRLEQISGGLLQDGNVYRYIKPNPKLTALDELIDDLPKHEKLVVFAVYQHEIEEIAKHFSALNPVMIYGGVSAEKRAQDIARFQDATTDCRLLIAQIHSGGIGIDLTVAQTAVYYSRNWSLEDLLQSQDRLHRIGQQGTVNIITLIATMPEEHVVERITREGEIVSKRTLSIDQAISRRLQSKQRIADQITGDVRSDSSRDDVESIESVLS